MFDFDDLPVDMSGPAPAKQNPEQAAPENPEQPAPEEPALGKAELEQRWESISGVTAKVYMPRGASHVPLAVVLVPGNPGVDVVGPGTYHSHSPGMKAIAEELEKAGIPFVHYDYQGIGLSAPGGSTGDKSKWEAPAGHLTEQNTKDVIAWASKHITDRVVACCWNYGACDAAHVGIEGGLHALVSVSLGYNVYMSYFIMGARPMGEWLKSWYDEFNRKLDCKTLYVVGNMDKAMTPMGHVKRFIKERTDGGKNATLHVIDQKGMQMSNDEYFQLKGSEDEVAQVCKKYIEDLIKELDGEAHTRLLGA